MAIDPRIRARRVEVRRAEGRRRLRFLLVAVGLVALAIGAWGLSRTPLLDLDHVRIEGVAAADARTVDATAALERGTAMFDLDLGAVERDVTALSWVRSATAEREWPGTVRLTVVPREAVAVVGLASSGPSYLVDGDGVLIRTADSDTDLPRVALAPSVGLGEVEERSIPGLAVAVAMPDDLRPWVEAITLDPTVSAAEQRDLGLDLIGAATVHIGAGDFIDDKLAAVRAVLEGIDLTCVDVIDVAVADLPTVRRDQLCDAAGANGTVSGDA